MVSCSAARYAQVALWPDGEVTGLLVLLPYCSESLIKRNAYLPIPLHTPLIAFWLLSSAVGGGHPAALLLLLILIPCLLCVLRLYGAAFPVFQQYSLCPALSPLIVLTLLRATHSCRLSLSHRCSYSYSSAPWRLGATSWPELVFLCRRLSSFLSANKQ